MNRRVRQAAAALQRVNEWLTWGYLMLPYLSALLSNRLALRAGVNDGAMIHHQRAEINRTLHKPREEGGGAAAADWREKKNKCSHLITQCYLEIDASHQRKKSPPF